MYLLCFVYDFEPFRPISEKDKFTRKMTRTLQRHSNFTEVCVFIFIFLC